MAGNVVSNVKKYYGGQVPVPGQGDSDGKVKVLVEKTATIEIGGVQTEVELLYDADDLTTPVTPQQLGQWTDENYLIAFKKREDDGRVRGFILYALETDSTSTDTLVNRAEFISFKEDMAHEPGASAYEFAMVEDSSTLARYLRDENGELIVKFDKASVEDGAQSDTLDNLIGSDSEYMRFEVVREGDNAYLNLNTESLDKEIEYIQEDINYLVGAIAELPSDEHGYFNSSLYTTPGDGTTTNLVMDDFRISQGRDVHGESIEFVPTHQEGGIDFGEVYLNPGTYIFTVHYTLQWVGNPRGTFLPLVTNVGDRPFDFSYEHEDVVRTTRIVTRTTRGKFSLGFPIDADTPQIGIWVKNLEIAQIASYNHAAVAHDTTLTGTGKLDSPLGVTPAAFGKVKDIPTSISQFRTGDVIPVDGPNGPAKMGKDDLLTETAQSTLSGNMAPTFDPTRDADHAYSAGESVMYNGVCYMFKAPHYGAWTGSDVVLDPQLQSSLPKNHTLARLLGNRLDDRDFTPPGAYVGANGEINLRSNVGNSGLCPCVPGEYLSFYSVGSAEPNTFYSIVGFFDKDKKYLSSSISAEPYRRQLVPTDAYYFCIPIGYTDGVVNDVSVTNFICDHFLPYSTSAENVHTFVASEQDPENILNPASITYGGYIDWGNVWHVDATFGETDFIDVSQRMLFIWWENRNDGRNANEWPYVIVAQYDANKNFLGMINIENARLVLLKDLSPSTKYVRVPVGAEQAARGDYSIGYRMFTRHVPFNGNTRRLRVCDLQQTAGQSADKPMSQKAVTDALNMIHVDGLQWVGKKWYAYGTSITDTTPTGKYLPYLAAMSGMIATDKGIGGGGIGDLGAYSRGQVFSAICNTTDGKTEADLITLETGANDTDANVQLGTIYDTTQTTLAGCLNLCIRYLQTNTNAQIAVMPSVATTILPNEADQYFKWQLMIRDICAINRVFFIEPACNLGYGKLTGPNGTLYCVDSIHQTALGGYILAEAMWEQIKRIPNFRTVLPA